MRAVLLGLFGLAATVHAADVTFSSGSNHVALIELFTSEGCSSCPPAEAWLSRQIGDANLWRTFVPVSWHVDYWNRLGWPDRFSTREFTQRQYDYVTAWRAESVYTPCFVRDGREWHPNGAGIAGAEKGGAILTVHYDGRDVRADYAAVAGDPTGTPRLAVHAVLLGSGIRSRVTAGENRGATLEHDFVALQGAQGALGESLRLPLRQVAGVTRYALAVWITAAGSVTPLQTTGGWLGSP